MMPFEAIARKYDLFNSADYEKYAEFIVKSFSLADIAVHEVLDAGCGTGSLSLMLSHAGYDMVCTDVSADMLGEFRKKLKGEDVLLLMQDMRSLDLFGTVQAAISTFDCLNYLPDSKGLRQAFSSVSLFLEKGGLFVFDVNNAYAYESVYGTNNYVYEDDNSMLIWQNAYNGKSKKCVFSLTLFEQTESGWMRSDEEQKQTYFSPRVIESAYKDAGFELVSEYGGTDMREPYGENPKTYYILKKVR